MSRGQQAYGFGTPFRRYTLGSNMSKSFLQRPTGVISMQFRTRQWQTACRSILTAHALRDGGRVFNQQAYMQILIKESQLKSRFICNPTSISYMYLNESKKPTTLIKSMLVTRLISRIQIIITLQSDFMGEQFLINFISKS